MLGFFTKETKSFYIARPAEAARDFIYLHPDTSIPRGAKITNEQPREQGSDLKFEKFLKSLDLIEKCEHQNGSHRPYITTK